MYDRRLGTFSPPNFKGGELSPDGSQVDLFVDRTLLNSVRTQGDYRRRPILFQNWSSPFRNANRSNASGVETGIRILHKTSCCRQCDQYWSL